MADADLDICAVGKRHGRTRGEGGRRRSNPAGPALAIDVLGAVLAVSGWLTVIPSGGQAARSRFGRRSSQAMTTPSDGAVAPTRQPHRTGDRAGSLDAHAGGDPNLVTICCCQCSSYQLEGSADASWRCSGTAVVES